jgi:hypothetical protein
MLDIYSHEMNTCFQIKWLLWRNLLGLIREPFSFKIQIAQTFVRF